MVHSINNKLEALLIILDYSLNEKLVELFNENKMPVLLTTSGQGTAKSVMYDILGYGGKKKIVALSLQTEAMSKNFMHQLTERFELNKPGTGIACSLSLSSISRTLAQTLTQADNTTQRGSEEMAAASTDNYHLVITIVNSGHFEQVMEAAKEAGAKGGTLVHARGLGSAEAVKYLGITIQPEKDLVLILTPETNRRPIMENITKVVGLNTAGNGICFSLPVNEAIGLGAGIENVEQVNNVSDTE
ncbi:MAG: P-II family nitrogen regulator [Firmicutes bacterium]|nr:P-II family nitrogen regulator [Bacillota bacterium]